MPWAFLLDPFGVMSLAPETNEAGGRHWHAATFSGVRGIKCIALFLNFNYAVVKGKTPGRLPDSSDIRSVIG